MIDINTLISIQISSEKHIVMRVLVLLVVLHFLAIPSYGEEPDKLLGNTCAVCHALDRIKAKRLDKGGWEEIIGRMVTYGANVSRKEKKILVEYLTKTYGPGAGSRIESHKVKRAYTGRRVSKFDFFTKLIEGFLSKILAYEVALADKKGSTIAYVGVEGEDEVWVINLETENVLAKIKVGRAPHGIVFGPNKRYGYVSNIGSHNISVIDVSKNKVVDTIPARTNPLGAAVTPDGKTLLVATPSTNDVLIFDISPGDEQPKPKLIASIPTETLSSYMPHLIAVSPDSKRAWVTNMDSGDISVIDISKKEIVSSIKVGNGPHGIAGTPDGKYLWVALYDEDKVVVVDALKNEVIRSIEVGRNPFNLDISPDGKYVWVSSDGTDSVIVVDTTSFEVVDTIPVPRGAHGIDVSPDGKTVWVVSMATDVITGIDTSTRKVIKTIPVGRRPHAISVLNLSE